MLYLTKVQAKRFSLLLEQTFLFNGFAKEEIEKLLMSLEAEYIQYASGETILDQNSLKPCLGILLSGSAIVEKHSGEGVMRMSMLTPGQLFGMASLFSSGKAQPYPVSILAKNNTAALLISEETLKELFYKNHILAENYICHLTGRIHFLNKRLEYFIRPTVEERVLFYLTQNAIQGAQINSFTALAKSLCISRASLYRALDNLEKNGSIKRNGHKVDVLVEQPEPFL